MEHHVEQATKQPRGASATRKPGRLTLDDLAAMDARALRERYTHGTCPTDLRLIDGKPKGRMLTVRRAGFAPVAPLLRAFAASASFPWDGKTFFGDSEHAGRGINRVRIAGAKFDAFDFATRVGPSLVDGKSTIVLDYAQPDNPPYIQKIHDEIRDVGERLFLGPAMWKRDGGGAAHVLWFALDFGHGN